MPFILAGDFEVVEFDELFLTAAGRLVFDAEAERWFRLVGDVVLAIDPLFIKEPGRSPNLGKAKEKSLPLPLL